MKILKVLSAVALCACFSAQATLLNFNDYTIDSYGGTQDVYGSATVSADGSTLGLEGNLWKSINYNSTISAATIMYFDFMSTSKGEIHGIGFDNNSSVHKDSTYNLIGTQNWGRVISDQYQLGDGWKTYEFNLGNVFSGNYNRIFFAMDNDVPNSTANSFFRNIQICDSCDRMTASVVSAPATGSILALGMLLLTVRRFTKS